MLDSLFGDMTIGLRVIIVFALVLALLAGCMWLLRRYGAGRVGGGAARGRQPRLAVVDSAAVDGRRRLVIVRRDNIEHLLMIGGPTDVVVEQNIVRAMPASRDRGLLNGDGAARVAAALDGAAWSSQPQFEPAPRASLEPTALRASRMAGPEDSATRPVEPALDSGPRPARGEGPGAAANEPGPRIASAHDLDSVASRIRAEAAAVEAAAEAPRFEPPRDEPLRAEPPRVEPLRGAARAESRGMPRVEPMRGDAARAESPRDTARIEPLPLRADAIREPARPAAPAAANQGPLLTAGADQNLAEMAQLLEVALRRPGAGESRQPNSGAGAAPTPLRSGGAPEPMRGKKPAEPAPATETKPVRAENKPKSLYDSIEQEMASLLSRPAGKP